MICAPRRILSLGANLWRLLPISKREEFTTVTPPSKAHPLYILGSGSIGLFLAAAIRSKHPSYPLNLLLRDHHAPNLKRNNDDQFIPISLQKPSNDNHDVAVPAKLISTLEPTASIQTLVLTTKAFQAVDALQSIHSSLNQNARIIVLCNGGLAVREELERAFSSHKEQWRIELASITHGVYRPSPYSLVHAGVGTIFLTAQSLDDDAMAPSLLTAADLQCRVVSQTKMEDILWYKLAANCVCNPITALHQCTNGEMYDHVSDFDQVLQQVVEEVCAVQRVLHPTALDPEEVTPFVTEVIRDNWNNRSSMQQDVYHKRPTEINFLNGYIFRMGEAHGIECPTNRELQLKVLDLQESYTNV